jgi:hypothetical protein
MSYARKSTASTDAINFGVPGFLSGVQAIAFNLAFNLDPGATNLMTYVLTRT